jgi:hypothetical protein
MFTIEQKFSDSQEFPCFLMEYIRTHDRGAAIYTRKNLTTCRQDVFATGLQQTWQQVVTMQLLFYQVVTRLSLTIC